MGSGPMPLTSFIMAIHHMKFTHFDNFDVDEAASGVAVNFLFLMLSLRRE